MKVKEHLEELKKCFKGLIFPSLAIILISLFSAPFLLKHFITYLGINAYAFSPLESFIAQMQMGLFMLVVCLIPLMTYALYKFVKPAYNLNKFGGKILLFGILGMVGFLFGSTIFSKFILNTLANGLDYVNMWSILSVVSFTFYLGLALAISTEIPLFMPLLQKMGIINTKKISRAMVLISLLVIAAIITPGGDIFTQCLVGLPMYASFEVGMITCKLNQKEV